MIVRANLRVRPGLTQMAVTQRLLELVEKEWRDNVGNVSIELEKHLQELHDNLIKFSDTLEKIGTISPFYNADLRSFVSSQKVWVNLPKPDRFWKPVSFFPPNLERIRSFDIDHKL